MNYQTRGVSGVSGRCPPPGADGYSGVSSHLRLNFTGCPGCPVEFTIYRERVRAHVRPAARLYDSFPDWTGHPGHPQKKRCSRPLRRLRVSGRGGGHPPDTQRIDRTPPAATASAGGAA